MEEKLKRIENWFTTERIAIIGGIVMLLILLTTEILGIAVAVIANNYLLLSIVTYLLIMAISEMYIKEKLLKKLVKPLLKKPYTSNVIFFVVGVITIALSWKYFIAFLLCIPQAILYGQYCRLKEGF